MEGEKILHNLFAKNRCLDFCLSEFYFQFEFFYYFIFQVRETHLKSFVCEILFIADHSLTFYFFDKKD